MTEIKKCAYILCEKEFEGKVQKKYCSPICAKKATSMRERNRKGVVRAVCSTCHKSFVRENKGQRRCLACRKYAEDNVKSRVDNKKSDIVIRKYTDEEDKMIREYAARVRG